ncbi:hypothetical protein AB0442_38835 [Kitasatospora sp. NPDC085895]
MDDPDPSCMVVRPSVTIEARPAAPHDRPSDHSPVVATFEL